MMLKSGIPNLEKLPRNPGPDADDVIFGGKFKFELGGEAVPITSYSGGGVTFEKKEATEGNMPNNIPENIM